MSYSYSEISNNKKKQEERTWTKFYGGFHKALSILVSLHSNGRVSVDTRIREPQFKFYQNKGSKKRFDNALKIAQKRISIISDSL